MWLIDSWLGVAAWGAAYTILDKSIGKVVDGGLKTEKSWMKNGNNDKKSKNLNRVCE